MDASTNPRQSYPEPIHQSDMKVYKLVDESNTSFNNGPRHSNLDRASLFQEERMERRRKVHIGCFALFIFLYMAYILGKNITPACRGLGSPSRKMIYGVHHNISHAKFRNVSTLVDGKLPTHYTLPSGDKIPSIALGMSFESR